MRRSLFALIVLLLAAPAAVSAQSEVGGVENVFSYGAGLRALGMGGAFTAMTGDPTLGYWNPGAMAFNQYKEISVFGTRTIADTYYAAAFYTHPTISLGTLGLGGMGIYTGGIESYDAEGSPITDARTDYLHYQVLASYGYNFRWGLGVGATGKVEQMRITDYQGTGGSFDLGAYFSPPAIPWLALGAVVQNVYSTGIRLADTYEPSTRMYKGGLATNFSLGGGNSRLTFAMDHRVYTDNYNPGSHQLIHDMAVGMELAFSENFMVRAGYGYFTLEDAFQNLPVGLAVGMTVRQWGIGIEYAVNFEDSDWQGTAELLMRLGLSYRFGVSIDEKRELEASRIRRQIEQGIQEATQQFEQRMEELSQQYEREKRQVEQQIEQQYQERIEQLGERIEEERQDLVADLTAQLEAERQEALSRLNQQFNQERAALELELLQQQGTYESRIEQLEQRFEQERQALRQEIVADEAFKSERYAQGLQLFSDGQFEEALAEFQTVARYDPNYLNVQEYIRRSEAELRDVSTYPQEVMQLYYNGIDLFVQQRYREAITEWQKILEIDPYNKLALRNIREARSRLRKLQELGISE